METADSAHVVLLTEEFGFAYWYWYPGLSPEHTARWWRGVEPSAPGRVSPFFTRDLPGRLVRATDEAAFLAEARSGRLWTGHAHTGDDSCLVSPSGEEIWPLAVAAADPVRAFRDASASRLAAVGSEVDQADQRLTLAELRRFVAGWALDASGARPAKRLRFAGYGLGPGAGAVLAGWPGLAAVARLDLSANGLGDEDAQALAGSAYAGGLRALDLAQNAIGDAGAAALAGMESLDALDLSGNPAGEAGRRALAERRGWPIILAI